MFLLVMMSKQMALKGTSDAINPITGEPLGMPGLNFGP